MAKNVTKRIDKRYAAVTKPGLDHSSTLASGNRGRNLIAAFPLPLLPLAGTVTGFISIIAAASVFMCAIGHAMNDAARHSPTRHLPARRNRYAERSS